MSPSNNPFGLSDDTMRLVELLHQSQEPEKSPFDYVADWEARFDGFARRVRIAASNACMAFMIANKQNVVVTHHTYEEPTQGTVTLVIKAIGPRSVAITQRVLLLSYSELSVVYGSDTVLKAKITETVRKVGEHVAEAERKAAKQGS